MDTVSTNPISEGVQALKGEYKLSINKAGNLVASPSYNFVSLDRHPDVEPLRGLPRIQTEFDVSYLVPSGADLPARLEGCSSPQLTSRHIEGEALIPEVSDDWTDSFKKGETKIGDALLIYAQAVERAHELTSAHELLKQERSDEAGLYASLKPIDDATPMLVDGLVLEAGVSVVFGDFDEFKTTVAVDLAAHIAYGADWQGRRVRPHPVIYYALDGDNDIPVRLQAIEAKLRGKDTPWGDDRAPVTVLDRVPDDRKMGWRSQILETMERWRAVHNARCQTGEIPMIRRDSIYGTGESCYVDDPRYPCPYVGELSARPVIIIDTLSIALGGEDEKGHAAAGFIHDCLDLLKERYDLIGKDDNTFLAWKAASHVIIIHHQTKTGIDFGGHRAIGANTQGLYRIHRFGKINDAERSFSGQITPIRVKDIPRPAPLRFEVEAVRIGGTNRTAAILKDKAAEIPPKLSPIIEALRAFDDGEEITRQDLNVCLDVLAAAGEKGEQAKRQARARYKKDLEAHGLIVAVEDDNGGNTARYQLSLGAAQ